MKKRNLVAAGLVLAVVAAVAAWALRPRAIVVDWATVARGAFEQTVTDDGRTRARDRYVVSAPLAGRLERIALRAGDPVARGAVVAQLLPADPAFHDARTLRELGQRVGAAEAQQQRARAEMARLAALRDQAQADLDRQDRLAREGFVSAAAREQADLALKSAERALQAARFAEDAAGHDLAQARAALGHQRSGGGHAFALSSPVRGSVLRVLQESEAVVAAGTPLVEIADARSLEAVVDVLSQDSVAILPGMPARIELGPGVPALAARVRLVEPAGFTKVSALGIEEQRVNVVLDFVDALDAIPTLGDGYRVDAHIIVTRVPDALEVPVGALFRDGAGWAAFVVEDGRAVKRAVVAPRRNPLEAEVQSGLKEGERVVVYPPDALREGARVALAPR